MKVTIFGAGYVGLVTGICLADLGHQVVIVDVDSERVKKLQSGQLPIYEPELDVLLQRVTDRDLLECVDSVEQGVRHGEILMIAVGTPSNSEGAADLTDVFQVAESIGEHLQSSAVVVNKSTVPVGTADAVRSFIQHRLEARAFNAEIDVVSNPEFLREGTAVHDFMHPDRIVVGAEKQTSLDQLHKLYAPIIQEGFPFLAMDARSAELTKYAANSFLAAKVSFMNEISQIAERLGADVERVRLALGKDPRISDKFLAPGCGFGGSCFPKDVQALCKSSEQHGYRPQLLNAVHQVNLTQKRVLFDKIATYFKNDLANKIIAVWGLSFKPNTDDMRAAPSRVLIEALLEVGATIQAYDPVAMDMARSLYPKACEQKKLVLASKPLAALKNADALALVTEWDVFNELEIKDIKKALAKPVIFDGRNVFNPADMKRAGIKYFGIGRGDNLNVFTPVSSTISSS